MAKKGKRWSPRLLCFWLSSARLARAVVDSSESSLSGSLLAGSSASMQVRVLGPRHFDCSSTSVSRLGIGGGTSGTGTGVGASLLANGSGEADGSQSSRVIVFAEFPADEASAEACDAEALENSDEALED